MDVKYSLNTDHVVVSHVPVRPELQEALNDFSRLKHIVEAETGLVFPRQVVVGVHDINSCARDLSRTSSDCFISPSTMQKIFKKQFFTPKKYIDTTFDQRKLMSWQKSSEGASGITLGNKINIVNHEGIHFSADEYRRILVHELVHVGQNTTYPFINKIRSSVGNDLGLIGFNKLNIGKDFSRSLSILDKIYKLKEGHAAYIEAKLKNNYPDMKTIFYTQSEVPFVARCNENYTASFKRFNRKSYQMAIAHNKSLWGYRAGHRDILAMNDTQRSNMYKDVITDDDYKLIFENRSKQRDLNIKKAVFFDLCNRGLDYVNTRFSFLVASFTGNPFTKQVALDAKRNDYIDFDTLEDSILTSHTSETV